MEPIKIKHVKLSQLRTKLIKISQHYYTDILREKMMMLFYSRKQHLSTRETILNR